MAEVIAAPMEPIIGTEHKDETSDDLLSSLDTNPMVSDSNAIIIITMSEGNNSNAVSQQQLNEDVDDSDQSKDKACPVCGKAFRQLSGLRRHMQTHSSNTDVVHCPTCDKAFEYGSSLKRHMKTHSEENDGKSYECRECSKRFMYSTSLQRHLRKHIGNNESNLYSCESCDRTFNYLSSLKRHEMLHSVGKQFSCSVCGKLFGYSASLMRHEKLHSRDKQFFCSICQKSFRTEKGYLKHMQLHPGGNLVLDDGIDKSCEQSINPTMLHIKSEEVCDWNADETVDDNDDVLVSHVIDPVTMTTEKEE